MTDKKIDHKYSKLMGKVDYDHEAAEQLAEALNEITQKELEVNQLKQLISENNELHQFVWRSGGGEVTPLHKLEDDHLNNIMLHLLRHGDAIPRAIRGEAMQRGLVIPAIVPIDWNEDDYKIKKLNAAIDRRDII